MDCFPPAYSNNPAHFMWDKSQDLVALTRRGGHFCDSWLLPPGSLRQGEGLPCWLMTGGLLTLPQGCCSRSRAREESQWGPVCRTGWEHAPEVGWSSWSLSVIKPTVTIPTTPRGLAWFKQMPQAVSLALLCWAIIVIGGGCVGCLLWMHWG